MFPNVRCLSEVGVPEKKRNALFSNGLVLVGVRQDSLVMNSATSAKATDMHLGQFREVIPENTADLFFLQTEQWLKLLTINSATKCQFSPRERVAADQTFKLSYCEDNCADIAVQISQPPSFQTVQLQEALVYMRVKI